MKTKIQTKGMHCKSCDMLVEDSLGDVDGVNSVKSSFETGIVEIDFDESVVNIDNIKDTIKQEGYEVV